MTRERAELSRALLAVALVASSVAWFAALGVPDLVALVVAAAGGVAAAALVRRELGLPRLVTRGGGWRAWLVARRRRRAGVPSVDVEVYRRADAVYTAVTITWSDGDHTPAVAASPARSRSPASSSGRARVLRRALVAVGVAFVVGLVMAALGAPSWPTMLVAYAGGIAVARVAGGVEAELRSVRSGVRR